MVSPRRVRAVGWHVRFAEVGGAHFVGSELADELCAFGERYGLESVLEILEGQRVTCHSFPVDE